MVLDQTAMLTEQESSSVKEIASGRSQQRFDLNPDLLISRIVKSINPEETLHPLPIIIPRRVANLTARRSEPLDIPNVLQTS